MMGKAVQPAPTGRRDHYERQRPEETVLYQLVQEHLETFLAQVEAETGAAPSTGLYVPVSQPFYRKLKGPGVEGLRQVSALFTQGQTSLILSPHHTFSVYEECSGHLDRPSMQAHA